MSRNYQSGFGYGVGNQRQGFGGMPGSSFPSTTPGSRMSDFSPSGYSSTFGNSSYGSGTYSQSGFGGASYGSGGYQNQGFGSSSTGSYSSYGSLPSSGLAGTSTGNYGNMGTSGAMGTREFSGSGIDSDYRRDSDYWASVGGMNINVRSSTDTLTLSDFIDDKRGDKSWDPVKRKYRYESGEEESTKRQRHSEGRETDRKEETKKDEKVQLYLGNLPSNVTKEKIETMFAYIPGIMSYSLQRHKYNMSNTCIFVEMTDREAGENLRKTFDWMEVNGRCIVCRFSQEGEEENFIPDPHIKSDNFQYKTGAASQSESASQSKPQGSRSCVFVSNLPGDSTQDDLESFVSDLHYSSVIFVKGDHLSGKPGHAYFYTTEAEKMVNELQGTYYLGSYIDARIEEKRQNKHQDTDDYLPVPLGDAEDFVSHGARRSADRAPAHPPGPRKQPSEQFEEYIKNEITPLIGLEYVTEYATPQKNTPRYQCELCAATPQGASIVAHIVSLKHRLNYMEKKDPDRYQRITSMSQQKSFLTAECLKYANEIEARDGRQLIKIERSPQNTGPKIQDQDMRQIDDIDQSSDLFSRLTAYKQKIKEIEEKQKEKQLPRQPPKPAKTSAEVAKEQRNEAKILLKEQLSTTNDPILGLEFLKAQPNPLKPSTIPFNCTLCGTKLGHHGSFISHVIGLAHRLEYFKRRHHDLYLVCSKITNRSSQRKLVEEHSVELESQDGRGTLFVDGELIAGEDKETSQPRKMVQQSTAAVVEEIEEEEEGFEADASSVHAQLFDMVKNMDKVPLVGLRYVTETQSYNSYDPPKYKCSLCDVNVSKTFIITHITGHQHRLEYIKKNYPELEKDATSDRDTLNNYCRDIENDIGREPVNVVIMRPPKDLNSPVTYSKPIPVKAPSKVEEAPPTQEPKKPPPSEAKPAQAPQLTPTLTPAEAPALAQPRPEFQMSKLEKRAASLQNKIKNRHKLTPQQQEELSRQLKNDGKKEDGSVVHFYDLIEEHESEPLLGLASCVEVWHPKDLEPPLFRCDICDFDTNFKHIVEHLMGKQHKMEYFKWMHPDIYQDIIRISNPRDRDNFLKKMVTEFDKKHVRETIQYTVATDDLPWKNWKKNVNLMAYMRFDAQKREKKLGNNQMPAEVAPQLAPEPRQYTPEPVRQPERVQPVDTYPADSGTGGMQQEEITPQSDSVADMIDGSVINDEKWDEINAEIKKRIGGGRIIIKKDPAKFLKTYKPFLTKFPIIGLEWLSEFQLGDENTDPWYLCRLCRSKISWSDVVDHVISIYHRMSFIQKEHPTLHELLKEEMWKPGGEREMNDKIEEFAKGIAKPPSEQTLEVLLEKVNKPNTRTPMKDYTSMAQSQGAGGQVRPLDFDRGQGDQQQRNQGDNQPRAQGGQQSWGQGDRQSQERSTGNNFANQGQFDRRSQERNTGNNFADQGQFDRQSQDRSNADNKYVPGQFEQVVEQQLESGVGAKGSDAPQQPQITGRQAAKNAKRAKLNKVPGAMARFPTLYGNKVFQALVGLEYLVEIQVIGEDFKKPEYLCELCDCDLYTNVVQHLLGYKHRAAFFLAKFPDRNSGQISEQMAADYERQYGRGLVQVVREGKGAKKQRQLDAIKAKREVQEAKKAFREHNLKEHQSLEAVRVEHGETPPTVPQGAQPQSTSQEEPEKETPASRRGLKITQGARAKFPIMFGSKATRALIGLEHLVEIQLVGEHKERRPLYLCELCDTEVGPGCILQHLYGHKHRQKFFNSIGRQGSQMTEQMAENHEKMYGRGLVRVVVEDRQARRIREKEMRENLRDRKEQSAQGLTSTSSATQQPIARPPATQGFQQTMPAASVTGPPATSTTVQPLPGTTFTGQQMPMVQQERFSPFPQQNLQPVQTPPPLMQIQTQPGFQQPQPLMQQQPQPSPILQQQMQHMQQQQPQQPQVMMQQGPPMMQGMQQPAPLMQQPIPQPQMVQQTGFSAPVQQPQPAQMQPSQVIIQQPPMMPQMSPNIAPMVQQQNVQMGMTNMAPQHNMAPQQNIPMRPSGMPQPVSSQQGLVPNNQPMVRPQHGMQGMGPNSQPMVRPQHGIPPSKDVPFDRSVNQRPPSFDRPWNSQSYSRPQNRQLTTVNVQKTTISHTKSDKPDNKEPNKEKADFTNYKIPKKDSPRKGIQDSKYNDRNRNDSRDSRKPDDRATRDTSDSRQSSGPARDDRKSGSSTGRQQDSRAAIDSRSGRSGSRDSKSSSSRRDRDRSPGSGRSDRFKYTDHRRSEKDKASGSKSEDKKSTDNRRFDTDKSNGTKSEEKKSLDKSSDSKSTDNRKQTSKDRDKEARVDRSMEKSGQGAATKPDPKQKNPDAGKSKTDSDKMSDKPKLAENRAKDQSKNKVSDNKQRDNVSRNKATENKSGSFIEIESSDSDSSKKSKGKQESETASCIINVDVVPKRKNERTESHDDSKSKQAEIASSPSVSKDKDKSKSDNEKVKEKRHDTVDRLDNVTHPNVEIKAEPFKSPLKNPKGKLACAVTVDLVDISTLSQVKLEELKQGSPQKETAKPSGVVEASSASLVQKTKIKEEILSPKVKGKEEILSPQSQTKQAMVEPRAEKSKQAPASKDAVKVKQEIASPVSTQRAEARPEPVKRQSSAPARKDIWSVTDEWVDNKATDGGIDSNGKGSKEPRKLESKLADKVNIVVEVGVQDKSEKVEKTSQKEVKAKDVMPECSVIVEIGGKTKEPESMEVDESHIDDQRPEEHYQSEGDDDDIIDFSEFVTLDEEGEVDDMAIGTIDVHVEEFSTSTPYKKDSRSDSSRRNRSRSRDRSRRSGQSDYRSPRRSRSRDRHGSRHDRGRSRDRWSGRSGRSGDGDSRKSGSSQRQGTSRIRDGDSRSARTDKMSTTSRSGTGGESRSKSSSSTSKSTTRTTVEVEVSDPSTKSDDKSQKPGSSEEGLVATSRALLKEKAKSLGGGGGGAKSNQCSVEIGVVKDSPKTEKEDDSKTNDSDKQGDASHRQTRSHKPKCEVSVSID